jgi:seryl-tRNA synthetase
MLDLRFVLEHAELVKENCRRRRADADVDRLVQLATERNHLLQQVEELRHRRHQVAKATAESRDPSQRQQLVEEGRELKEELARLEARLSELEREVERELKRIPNLTHPGAPIGVGEECNREVRRWGEPRRFDFRPLDHLDLGLKLDLFDFERGAKVAGHNFYFLKNEAVLLELALEQYAIRVLMGEGFIPVVTPDVARDEILEGVGFIPRSEATQVYSLEGTELSLIATAEITIAGMHKDDLLQESELPLKYVGLSHCFRTESGAHGRATRGLYRVHQFSKVEMFAFTKPEDSNRMLEELCTLQERIFQGLGIPYRVVDTCTGELGGPAYRKYDLEAWMPGRGEGGEYAEVTSASNCTDYQARRLNIRFRRSGRKGTEFVHTLNGTAVAISRALIVVLENYQQPDGSVVVPEVLRPYTGFDRIAPKS